MKVNNLNEFLEARGLGETSMAQVRRNTYKFTDCGAWVEGEDGGVKVGSIVEGCDEGTQTHFLKYPFEISEFWGAIESVEDEADDIWKNSHGCEDCHPGGYCGEVEELEFGNWPINPDCKTCNGEGAII